MLSYRHAFHAGNHADVLKHVTLNLALNYLTARDKPLLYIDTHAGAGRYDLHSPRAMQNREHETGIARLWRLPPQQPPELLRGYLQVVRELNPDGALRFYPGSPWLARAALRADDRAWLYELQEQEQHDLRTLFAGDRQFRVEASDGFRALNALLPPPQRRALMLMDPPYEVKGDYRNVVQTLQAAYRKFPGGVYLAWYPIVNRAAVRQLVHAMSGGGLRDVWRFELSVRSGGAGMTGSGMLAINPPWQLPQQLRELLPWLHTQLGDGGGCRVENLAPE